MDKKIMNLASRTYPEKLWMPVLSEIEYIMIEAMCKEIWTTR